MSDIFADATPGNVAASRAKAPPPQPQAQDSDSESDIFEAVRKAAGAASASGIASASAVRSTVRGGMENIFAQVGAPAPPPAGRGRLPDAPGARGQPSPAPDEVSMAGSSELDLFALARGA